VSDLHSEMRRLADLLVPYLCERTGLSREQVESVMDAQGEFWESQHSIIGMIFGAQEDDEQDG